MRASRPHPNVWMYCPREHHLYEVLHWLAEREYFPRISWSELKETAIGRIREKRAKGNILNDVRRREGKRVFPYRSPDAPVETLEWMVEVKLNKVDFRPPLGWAGFVNFGDQKVVRAWMEAKARTKLIPIELEKFIPRPELSVIEWSINWYMPDSELIWYFSDALKRGRPPQFKEFARKAETHLSFAGAFPFRRGAALQWLGVLRRRRHVSTWREYMELYNDRAIKRQKGIRMKSPDIDALAAPRREDCRKAELILKWFEKGTPLNKKDFR